MTASSFNKYIKQNATDFNKEYAKYVEDSTVSSNKTDEIRKEFNNQSGQTIQIDHTDCVFECKSTSKVILRKGICYKQQLCRYKHEVYLFITLFFFRYALLCRIKIQKMTSIIQTFQICLM